MGRKSDLIEELVMELLVARCVRMGESRWPFPARAGAELRHLESLGMVSAKGGIVEGTLDVSITDKGRAEHAPVPLPDAQAANLERADREVDRLLAHALDVLGDITRDIARDGEPIREAVGMADAIGEARRAWRDRVLSRDDDTDRVKLSKPAPGGAGRNGTPVELSWVLRLDTYSRWELRDPAGVRWGWAVNAADGGRWTAHVGDFGQAERIGETPPRFEDEVILTVGTATEARRLVEERLAALVQTSGFERAL